MLSNAVCDVMAKPHCYYILRDQSDNKGYVLFTVGLAYPRLLIVDDVLHAAGTVLNHSSYFCLPYSKWGRPLFSILKWEINL